MKTRNNAGVDVQNSRSTNRTRRSTKSGNTRAGRERVLVEFPSSLLERADEAAAQLQKNRSELIRTAVEKLLEAIEKAKFEQEMAEGYIANSAMNLSLLKEFAHVDHEGF